EDRRIPRVQLEDRVTVGLEPRRLRQRLSADLIQDVLQLRGLVEVAKWAHRFSICPRAGRPHTARARRPDRSAVALGLLAALLAVLRARLRAALRRGSALHVPARIVHL